MATRTPRRTVVPVSIPHSAATLIARAAAKQGHAVSAFIRAAAIAEAERVVGVEYDPTGPTPRAQSTAA